jgi:uncharacterized protein YdiU (UPF0061 family)
VDELLQLMVLSKVDYTILFRRLSQLPAQLSTLKESFYLPSSEELDARWESWLQRWRQFITAAVEPQVAAEEMKRSNPKVTWREWLIVSAYKQAEQGESPLIQELQEVFSHPYAEQSAQVEMRFDRLRPQEFFNAGGVSHYSCSS